MLEVRRLHGSLVTVTPSPPQVDRDEALREVAEVRELKITLDTQALEFENHAWAPAVAIASRYGITWRV